MQDQGNRDGGRERADQVVVEFGVAGGHGVRAAHRDRKGIDLGRVGEGRRFGGIGARSRGVGSTLATDLTELGLDPEAGLASRTGEGSGPPDVVRVGEVSGVDHDGGGAESACRRDGLGDQVEVLEMVQVDGERRGAVLGDLRAGRQQGCDAAAVEDNRVLAELDECGGPGALDALGHPLGVLDGDHVERHDRGTRRGRRRDEVGGRGKWHASIMGRSLKLCNANRPNDQ